MAGIEEKIYSLFLANDIPLAMTKTLRYAMRTMSLLRCVGRSKHSMTSVCSIELLLSFIMGIDTMYCSVVVFGTRRVSIMDAMQLSCD